MSFSSIGPHMKNLQSAPDLQITISFSTSNISAKSKIKTEVNHYIMKLVNKVKIKAKPSVLEFIALDFLCNIASYLI